MGNMLCKCTSPGCLCLYRLLPWRRDPINNDTAWKQQNREMSENPMYQYVDLQRGGKLVEAALTQGQGQEAVRRIIQYEVENFLYHGGKGATVTKIDWLRWRQGLRARMEGHSEVDVRSDDQILSDYTEDRFIKFEEHEACWDLNKRGGVGETILHLCFLNDSCTHLQIARTLLSLYPKLSLDLYEGDEYYGETCLHIAIVIGNFDAVKLLISNGAKVNQRATGRFFLPEDQKSVMNNRSSTNYEGYAYFGEYPLAFAACFGHEDIYNYLIDHGADPNLQDTFGNTVLHMVVINNQVNMYSYAVRHPVRPANTYIKNAAGLTPLTLASKLGRQKIFQEIIELSSIEIWRYSNITCSTYPLTALDTIGPSGDTHWKSALMFIIDGKSDEHLQMLDGGVISQLLDDKWKTFARRRFFERLILAFLHLIVLSVAVYLRPRGEKALLGPVDTDNIVRYVAEIIVCIDCFMTVCLNAVEIITQGLPGYAKNMKSAPAKTVFFFSCLLILTCIPLRFFHRTWEEEILLTMAMPGSWMFLLYFARGVKLYGPFVTMIYKMLRGDLLRFGIIYAIVLVSFAQGFYFLFKDIENETITTFRTIFDTLMTLFQMTLGEFKMSKGDMGIKYEEFGYTRYAALTKIVFFCFMVLVPILLLNMLIAMMGNTYQQVINRSEKEWKRQKAQIIVNLERSYTKKQLKNFLFDYSVKLGTPPKDFRGHYAVGHEDQEHRGLMVIKTTNKTKAKQRKGAILNWKYFHAEVKKRIRVHKLAGHKTPYNFPDNQADKKQTYELDVTLDDDKELLSTPRIHYIQSRKASTVSTKSLGLSASLLSGGLPVGLASAIEQLAWERDLDLAKGMNTLPPKVEIDKSENNMQNDENKMSSISEVNTKSTPQSSDSVDGIKSNFPGDGVTKFKAPEHPYELDIIDDPLVKDILKSTSKPKKHGFVNTLDSVITTADINYLDDDVEKLSETKVPTHQLGTKSDETPGTASVDSSTSADSRRDLLQDEKRKKKGKSHKKSFERKHRGHSPTWSNRARVDHIDSVESIPKHVGERLDSPISPSKRFGSFPEPLGSMSSLLKAWDDDDTL